MSQSVNSASVEEAAAAWFAKRESGAWSSVEQAQLEAWLESSTAHRIAYIRLASAWERSGRLSALGAGVPRGVVPLRDSWNFPPSAQGPSATAAAGGAKNPHAASKSVWFRRLPMIAAALVVVGLGTAWYLSGSRANTYRTSIGALATIPLADGSKVVLNTDSQIDVIFNSKGRSIKLRRGEAFFEVSKDLARPFVVEIADKRVVAVGTQFSVRRDEDEIRVYVEEGRVRIKRPGIASKAAETQLPAGFEAKTVKTALVVDRPTPAQVEQLLGWRTGYLRFRDASLADAVVEFNRYSLHRIVIQDPSIADIRIGGSFRTDDADGFLDLLRSGFPVNVERRGETIVLTRR